MSPRPSAGSGFRAQDRGPHETARTCHDPDPAEIAFVRVEQAARHELPETLCGREDRTIVLLGAARGQFREVNDHDVADKIWRVVPEERGFGKTDRQCEIRHHRVRIDAFLPQPGRKIDRINVRHWIPGGAH